MKARLIIISAALVIASACNNDEKREAELEAARKAAADSVNALVARERMIDSMNQASIEQPSITVLPPDEAPKTASTPKKSGTSKPKSEKETGGTVKTTPDKTETSSPTATASAPAPEQGKNETVGTGTASTGEGETAGTEEKKKKGISTGVKGAVIGAGAGAVGGAIINKKNPGKGAIIGGVVGAGAGAVTGILMDKNKKKKQAEKDSAAKKEAQGSTTN